MRKGRSPVRAGPNSKKEGQAVDVEHVYSLLQDLYSREGFESEIKRVKKEFASLLDSETAALFLLAEKGRLRPETHHLNSLSDGEFVTVEGVVTAVEEPHEFTRRDGSTGRVVSVRISDGSGEARVSFWEPADIRRVESQEVRAGVRLRVINGRVKVNNFGTTVNVGSYSVVKVSREERKKDEKD